MLWLSRPLIWPRLTCPTLEQWDDPTWNAGWWMQLVTLFLADMQWKEVEFASGTTRTVKGYGTITMTDVWDEEKDSHHISICKQMREKHVSSCLFEKLTVREGVVDCGQLITWFSSLPRRNREGKQMSGYTVLDRSTTPQCHKTIYF